MTTKTRVPAVEGLFTMDDPPHLIGGKGRSRGSYFFPKDMAGADPACFGDDERDEVLLSRTGTVWSYTTSSYPPPLPYVVTTEPFVPLVIAAVELDDQKLVVCGQMVPGVDVADMSVGMRVELVLDTLYSDDDHDYLVWKWQPLAQDALAQDQEAGQ
ncbi:MAG: Zn-ribbon domain-containing OB-fold protein [Acidimicrobiales bacterium]